jgi:DNA-directed RNA polymerase subunit E'/Rpb7
MFIVVNVEDKLRVMPEEFDRPTADVLLERIQEKYVNKVNLVK